MTAPRPRGVSRRTLLHGGGLLVGGLAASLPATLLRTLRAAGLPEGALASEVLDALPGKAPLLKRTFRPPNYETPLLALGGEFTRNEDFFVRYHLPPPPEQDPAAFRLTVGGEGAATPLSLSLAELRRLPRAEVAALCLCAGNRRGLFEPHVPGVQWSVGAMGNGRFAGVRLRDVLRRAGVRADAVEAVFTGADRPAAAATPPFVKSLPLDKALDGDTLLAFEMNGAPLPRYHGAPLRLVVPGWAATYWMKHLVSIQLVNRPCDSFWMKTAYRIPRGLFPLKERFPGQSSESATPITELVVSSLLTSHRDGDGVPAGRPLLLSGVAWDGGAGVREVEVSSDGGRSFQGARLGPDHGRYAWRRFSHRLTAPAAGPLPIVLRARSRRDEVQPEAPRPNPAGYHHNVVQRLTLLVSIFLGLLLAAPARAGEERVRLKEGPGRELVSASCVGCHSLDYLQMNAPFLDRKGWEAVVQKMVKVMGAPIPRESVPPIVDYLTRFYGR